MTTQALLALLRTHPNALIRMNLPDGTAIPPHYHITEVGHVVKRFLDCGGKSHQTESCVLQVWLADDVDHRLRAEKLLTIIERSADLLPTFDLPLEIEHEAPVLTQLEIANHAVSEGLIVLNLRLKKTDCLAKDICLPDFSLPSFPGQASCAPGSGCC